MLILNGKKLVKKTPVCTDVFLRIEAKDHTPHVLQKGMSVDLHNSAHRYTIITP